MKIFEKIEEKIKLLAKILFIFSCVSAVICFLGFLDSIAWVANSSNTYRALWIYRQLITFCFCKAS
jgi:hypothetical protein